MYKGKLPTNVKAIISASGLRIEGEELTPYMLAYALNNRDHFNFVYQGDIFLETDEVTLTPTDPSPVFKEADLNRMTRPALLALCTQEGITVEDEPEVDELVEMILQHQAR